MEDNVVIVVVPYQRPHVWALEPAIRYIKQSFACQDANAAGPYQHVDDGLDDRGVVNLSGDDVAQLGEGRALTELGQVEKKGLGVGNDVCKFAVKVLQDLPAKLFEADLVIGCFDLVAAKRDGSPAGCLEKPNQITRAHEGCVEEKVERVSVVDPRHGNGNPHDVPRWRLFPEALKHAALEQFEEELAIIPFDAGGRELAVIGHAPDHELINVASEKDCPLEIDVLPS